MLLVSLNVEVREEYDKSDHVANLEIQPAFWEPAGPYHCTGCLGHGQKELNQLPLGDVSLPPEVWPQGRDRGESVVGIHQDVDEAVQGGTKVRVTTWHPVHNKPPDVEHTGMVVDV